MKIMDCNMPKKGSAISALPGKNYIWPRKRAHQGKYRFVHLDPSLGLFEIIPDIPPSVLNALRRRRQAIIRNESNKAIDRGETL
jgi:hypothetical protein